jgi:hypothetical protein
MIVLRVRTVLRNASRLSSNRVPSSARSNENLAFAEHGHVASITLERALEEARRRAAFRFEMVRK